MSKRLFLCNILGSFGYLSNLLQWLWAAIVWMPSIMNSPIQEFLTPNEASPQLPTVSPDAPSMLLIAVAVIVTVVIMTATVVVLLRLPVAIAKTGHKVTKKSADLLLPAVTKHKPATKKQKRHLTIRLIKTTKLALVLLPLVIVLFAYAQELSLEFSLVVFIGGLLAISSLMWFAVQYIIAHFLRVSVEKLS